MHLLTYKRLPQRGWICFLLQYCLLRHNRQIFRISCSFSAALETVSSVFTRMPKQLRQAGEFFSEKVEDQARQASDARLQ